MASANFDLALLHVLKHEGGFSNHPADPGGATMRGVIQRVYDAYRDRKGLGRRSVRLIENDELKEIYRRQYWDVIRGDELPSGVDYCVFDGAVNSGPVQSAKWLQRALRITADGHIGEETVDAASMYGDFEGLIDAICDQRMAFLKSLRHWGTFGTGWTRRVMGVRTEAKSMVMAAPALMPEPIPPLPVPRTEEVESPIAKAPPSEKSMTKSTTLWSVLGQILSAIGISIGQALSDWRVVLIFALLIVLFALWIGRERLRRIIDEAI